MSRIAKVQLGKNGVSHNFIVTLKSHFEKHENVKISVLESASRDRAEIKKMSEEILEGLGKNYTSRVIGFTIVVKRWRKAMRE